MKLLVLLSLLTLTSQTPKHSDFLKKDIKNDLIIGKSVLSFTTKEKMEESLLSAMSDKETAEKINRIVSEKKLSSSISICYGIYDDSNTWCLKGSENKKGSL